MNLILATVFAFVLIATPAFATPITATLDGCVMADDPRLGQATWFAPGFQAVAFDDPTPGCEPTIYSPISDAYIFDENRVENTLLARLNLDNLPTCGRRQYDLDLYLEDGLLDPMGLRSLVIDTGVACGQEGGSFLSSTVEMVPTPEPGTLLLVTTGTLGLLRLRRNRARKN